MLCAMSLLSDDIVKDTSSKNIGLRSHSAQGLSNNSSPLKIPLPPRLWITGKCYYAMNICHKKLLILSINIL